MSDAVVIEVQDAKKHFRVRGGLFRHLTVKAVDGVSLSIPPAHTLGLVGESGCGKSTLGRLILGLEPPTAGRVRFRGVELHKLSPAQYRTYRASVQAVFQDPFDSLNPRMRIGDVVGEPLRRVAGMTKEKRLARVAEVLEMVGLPAQAADSYPHEFSGGQRQRIAIARAISALPSLIVLDEAVSSLDVSIRAQIVNLLGELRDELGAAYLFISHDLHVVEFMSDIVAVMYLGKVVELAPKEAMQREHLHPYTKALFSAIPKPDPGQPMAQVTATGDPPDPAHIPPGCPFHPRCFMAEERCKTDVPLLREIKPNHFAACHLV